MNTNIIEIINAVKSIIDKSVEMKNAFFWSSPGNANGRRQFEKYHSRPIVEWDEGGHHYTAEYNVRCSCNHIYASGIYTKDGIKTNLTVIKNSIKRLELANSRE